MKFVLLLISLAMAMGMSQPEFDNDYESVDSLALNQRIPNDLTYEVSDFGRQKRSAEPFFLRSIGRAIFGRRRGYGGYRRSGYGGRRHGGYRRSSYGRGRGYGGYRRGGYHG